VTMETYPASPIALMTKSKATAFKLFVYFVVQAPNRSMAISAPFNAAGAVSQRRLRIAAAVTVIKQRVRRAVPFWLLSCLLSVSAPMTVAGEVRSRRQSLRGRLSFVCPMSAAASEPWRSSTARCSW
jgi:hypothetical protein